MSLPDEVLALFKLGWPATPSLLETRRKAMGVQHYVAEIAAWCTEINAQLDELAAQRDVPLLLMGGNAAALRLEIAKQRGSADNDYLTSASVEDIADLMDAFRQRFAAAPEPYFRPELIKKPEGAEELPLRAYKVRVPQITDKNPRSSETVVKVEFHLYPELPPHERLGSEMWAVPEKVYANVPLIPYQVGLKLMTLVAPPVGIDVGREDSIPRQIYDIDVLLAQMLVASDWPKLADYAALRYARECEQRGMTPAFGQPSADILARLDEWSVCRDNTTDKWKLVNAMQSAQLKPASQRLPEEWGARCRRVATAVRCLHAGDPQKAWQTILDIEALIPAVAQGAQLKTFRRALTTTTALPPTAKLRTMMWEHVGVAADADVAVERAEEIRAALPK